MRPTPLAAISLAALLAAACGTSMPKSPWETAPGSPAAASAATDPRERLVRAFNQAFNSQDAQAMAALVASDVQWIQLKGPIARIETKSKEELLRSMIAYFKQCPSCRARLAQVIVTKGRITVLEVATWTTSAGKKEEAQGFVVYEFEGKQFAQPRISRVYYFADEG
jgi:uncharacterized protein (TIGR02246 family)